MASCSIQTPSRWPHDWTPTILIIDDDALSRRILETRLRAMGCRVAQAVNGRDGLAQARQMRPDLIVVDWMMPELDGPEFCAVLKADDSMNITYVIMLTAKGETASLVEAFQAGADDYLAKPYEPDVLMARIAAGLQTRALQRRVEEMNAQLRHVNDRLLTHQQRLEDDLNHAAAFVRAMLPTPGPVAAGLTIAWRFTPSLRVGGDLFTVQPITAHLVGLYIMDLSGHGVGAALRAVSLSTMLQAGWRSPQVASEAIGLGWRTSDPAHILSHLERMLPAGDDGEHVTIWLGVWDRRSGTVTYASAGHPAPILIRVDGALERLGSPSLPLGFWSIPRAARNASVTLAEGDRLILFSDGLFDTFNEQGVPWGRERLEAACVRTRQCALDDALTAIVQDAQDWQQDERFRDDMAILGLHAERMAL